MLHLGCCVPFGHQQGYAEANVESQGLLGTLRRLWQGREQLNTGGEVADGFLIGRTIAGLLARSLPIDHRLLGAARRSVVLGNQLRLGLHQPGELCF